MLYYENFNLSTVVTPVNVKAYETLLKEVEYDDEETSFLVESFKHGFPLHYEGDRNVQLKAPNLKISVGTEKDLWNKVMKEVKLGRYAGPFKQIPYQNFIQSPIGLVPKDGGKDTRLIFQLSYPCNTCKKVSVNANIPAERCTVKYPDFADAIRMCLRIGKFCKLGKSDMKSAFRNLGMRVCDFCWLIMKAHSPIDKQWYYFIDKCLPFGSSISCAHFQRFSNSIAFVVKVYTGRKPINYLDDYLFAALRKLLCDKMIDFFLIICGKINFPVAIEKTEWSDGIMTFLGLLIDASRQVVCIPIGKVEKAIELINQTLSKKKVTVKTIQKLCGYLNFLCRCVVPGRAFLRRLYSCTGQTLSKNTVLPSHYHIRVKAELRQDLKTWLVFLSHPEVFCRPFMDLDDVLHADQVRFYTDSSGNSSLGMGGICDNSWMIQMWDSLFIKKVKPSIAYLELYALTAAVLVWLKRFKNRRIVIFCDNISVVQMINASSSSCKQCMTLIRMITLECLFQNVRIYAKYIKSAENIFADLLSCNQVAKFKLTAEKMVWKFDPKPTQIPEALWPMEKVWQH